MNPLRSTVCTCRPVLTVRRLRAIASASASAIMSFSVLVGKLLTNAPTASFVESRVAVDKRTKESSITVTSRSGWSYLPMIVC